MSDAFTSAARDQRGVLERLIKGLPGISGYADKELRRNADYRLRQMIADELDRQRGSLLETQNKLLKSGGLAFLDDLDVAVGRVQTLADRVRTASYGYAGFFDAVRIRDQELDALHRFDVAMLQRVALLEGTVGALRATLDDKSTVAAAIDHTVNDVDQLTQLFDRRERAIVTPDLLTSAGYAPEVRTDEAGIYDLTPVAAGSAQAAAFNTIPSGDYPPAPVLLPPDAAPAAPAEPVAPEPSAMPEPSSPIAPADAGVYTLTPSSDTPAAPA
ncbi:MAG: hypothetical protein ACRC1H_05540, partial [Caldilineaceae bacterium]